MMDWTDSANIVKKAGREARLPIVLTIRVLLQEKLLTGPRTQNPSHLAAVDRALV